MGKLRNRARHSNRLFAPLVFRVALRLEQIDWSEVSESASELVFVIRSAQKLFKLDAVCANFDSWAEVQSTGTEISRDALGLVGENQLLPASFPTPNSFPKVDGIARSIEVIRRLSDDSHSSSLPLAALTFGSTLIKRFYGEERAAEILESIREDRAGGENGEALEYVREVMLEIATGYLEAGAAGLLLLHEENTPDLAEMPAFGALFNLTAYYDVPAIVMCKRTVSARGIAMLSRLAGDYYLTPDEQSINLAALPSIASSALPDQSGWLGISRWEMDPNTDPEIIHHLRRATLGV